MGKFSGVEINEQWQKVQDAVHTRDAAYEQMRKVCACGRIDSFSFESKVEFADAYDEWMQESIKYLEMLK